MWKPDAVVPEHRWRARIVWAGLLLSIAAYTMWQIWNIYDGYNNISTTVEVTDETYNFPYLTVCFIPGQGCDENTDYCASTALEYSGVFLYADSEYYEVASETDFSNCIGFDLASLNLEDKDVEPENANVLISTTWVASQSASTDTDFFNNVLIYTSEGEPTAETNSYLYVPYLRLLPSNDLLVTQTVAEVTIGKTTKEDLDGGVKTTYPPLVLSTSEFTSDNLWAASTDIDDEIVYGLLNIVMRLGAYSRTSVKEISPLDLGDFFGNIGGFWELLIVFWGLFFIATREERKPRLKARDFAKTMQTGKEIFRRRSLSVDSGSPPPRGEERPHWESAFQGVNPSSAAPPLPPYDGATRAGGTAAAVGFPTMAPVHGATDGNSTATRRASTAASSSWSSTSDGNHRQQKGASSSSDGNGDGSGRFKRPVVQDVPRRGSRSASRPPAGRDPAPPSYAAMSAV